MATVKADTAALTQFSRRIQEISGEAHSVVRSMETIFAATKGPGWSGPAADAAEVFIGNHVRSGTQLTNILDTNGGALGQGATNMAGQEDAAAQQLRSLANSPGGRAGVVPGGAGGGSLSSTINA